MNNCIDSRIILNKDIKPIVYVYIMIIIVIVLSLIIFLLLFHYKTYYKVNGIVFSSDDKYYLKVYVPRNYIGYFNNSNVLYIDNDSYKYSIISTNEEYYTNGVDTYVIVDIGLELSDNYKYVKSYTFKLAATATEKILFYKDDIKKRYNEFWFKRSN